MSNIDEIKSEIERIKKDAEEKGRFSVFHTSFSKEFFNKDIEFESCHTLFETISELDKLCNIPYEIGVSLDRLSQDSKIYIRRIKLFLDKTEKGLPDSKNLLSIMQNGIYNNGHINAFGGSAITNEVPSLNLAMTSFYGLTGYMNFLSPYNDNDTIIIAAFPEDLVDDEGNVMIDHGKTPVYIYENSHYIINPEYIIGALLKKEGSFDEFYLRNEIIEQLSNRSRTEKAS